MIPRSVAHETSTNADDRFSDTSSLSEELLASGKNQHHLHKHRSDKLGTFHEHDGDVDDEETASSTYFTPSSSRESVTSKKLEEIAVERLGFHNLQKLYGRDDEMGTLQKEFQALLKKKTKTATNGKPQKNDSNSSGANNKSLVLVRGLSGSGKSALVVQALQGPTQRASQEQTCLFVGGKFELQNSDLPFAGILSALRQVCGQLANLPRRDNVQNENQLTFEDCQGQLQAQLTWEVEALAEFLPELQELVNRNTADTENGENSGGNTDNSNITSSNSATKLLEGKEASDQLSFAFRGLMNALTNVVPGVICLFCDDVQWADPPSLALLKSWMTDPHNKGLLLICAYRNNMVEPQQNHLTTDDASSLHLQEQQQHPVKTMIQDIGSSLANIRPNIVDVHLQDLQEDHVNEMLSDCMGMSEDRSQTKELTHIVFTKTNGNAFFVTQYVVSLVKKRLFLYNPVHMEWTWDIGEIQRGTVAASNVVALMNERLRESAVASMILPIAACIGATFSSSSVETVMKGIVSEQDKGQTNQPPMESNNGTTGHQDFFAQILGPNIAKGFSSQMLLQCEHEGLIESFAGSTAHAFIHDKVQEASLGLIPYDMIDEFKFRVAYILMTQLAPREREERMFDIVNGLNSRLDLLPAGDDLDLCREMARKAGEKAQRAGSFLLAAAYFRLTISLLPEDHWSSSLDSSVRLYTAAASSELSVGNFYQMRQYCDNILSQEECPLFQKSIAYNALIDSYITEEVEQKILLDLGLESLSKFGIILEEKGLADATAQAMAELKVDPKKTPEALLALPMTKDPTEDACVRLVMKFVQVCLVCGTTHYVPLLIIKASDRLVEKGQSKLSSSIFALMGFLVTNGLGDLKTGKEYALNARKHLEINDAKENMAIVYWFNEILTFHWTIPIQVILEKLLVGYKSGMANGDLNFAMWNIHFYAEYAFFSGSNLDLLHNDVTMYSIQMADYSAIKHLHCHQSTHQLILNLRGDVNVDKLTGWAMDEDVRMKMLEDNPDPHLLAHIQRDKLMSLIFFAKYEEACTLFHKYGEDACGPLAGQHSVIMLRFMGALCCYELARKTRKRNHLKTAKANQKILEDFAQNGVCNCLHYVYLIKAEESTFEQHQEEAVKFYEESIRVSGRSGFHHIQALANERLADLQERLGETEEAIHRYKEAAHLYGNGEQRKRSPFCSPKLTNC